MISLKNILKTVFLIILFFPAFVHAISYNGSSTYNIPNISDNTWVYYYSYIPAGDVSAYYLKKEIDTWVKVYQMLWWFKIPGGKSFSGEIMNFKLQHNTSDTNAYVRIFLQTWSTQDTFYYAVVEQEDIILETGSIMSVYHNNSCIWVSSDCLYIVDATFIAKDTLVWGGLYIPFFDFYYYYNNQRTTIHRRINFWSYNNTNQSAFTSFLTWFWFNTGEQWRLINYRTKTPNAFQINFTNDYSSMGSDYKYWYWARNLASEGDDSIFRDFMVNQTWTTLDAYWVDWINSSWYYTSTETWWTNWTWSTWKFTEWWYTDCWGFTDILCYVTNTFDWFKNKLFPSISFNWTFDSCDYEVIEATWWYMQKFANVISLVNPFPPDEWSQICLLFWWTWSMWYQRMIPDENFFHHYSPDWLPELTNAQLKYFWQTPFDIILIISVTSLIFYRKWHD